MTTALISMMLSTPLLLDGVLFLATSLLLLIFLIACWPAAAQRVFRLLEKLHNFIYGTCPSCGQAMISTPKRSWRIRKG